MTKKEQIIHTAFDLFSVNGFYATGVDRIMATAGVSKRTLYKYFPTKNDLIVAVMDFYRDGFKQKMRAILGQRELSPEEKIRDIFSWVLTQFDNPSFHGCLVISAMGEFDGKDEDIVCSCQSFKKWELGMFYKLAQEFGARDLDALSYTLFVLFEGLLSAAQVMGKEPPVDILALVQKTLVDAK